MSVPAVEVGVAAQHHQAVALRRKRATVARRPDCLDIPPLIESGCSWAPESPARILHRGHDPRSPQRRWPARASFCSGRLSGAGRFDAALADSWIRVDRPDAAVSGARLPCRRWFNGSAIPLRPRRRDEAACQENLAPSIAATLPHIGALSNAKAPCAFFCANRIFRVAGRPAGQAPLAQNAFLGRCAGCQVVVGQSSARKSRRPRAARNREGRRLRHVEQHRQVVERRGQFPFASGPRIRTPWRRAASASLRSRVASGNSVSIANAR